MNTGKTGRGHQVFLSMGSNVGDRRENLGRALGILRRHPQIQVLAVSRFYMTEPQNYRDQDWFVNAALAVETGLGPEDLLAALNQVEKEMDPEGKPFRYGPRIIDLDIIYYDDLVYASGNLEIPHPRMHERRFVLIPLCDVGAGKRHPVLGARPDELMNRIQSTETQKVVLLEEE